MELSVDGGELVTNGSCAATLGVKGASGSGISLAANQAKSTQPSNWSITCAAELE
ncbi:hypothetical protein D3C71_2198810 [compost metagenome]